jgi:hypothetical protein
MYRGIVILGNGFDLDLGLKSSYADFAKSEYWRELMNNNIHSKEKTRLLGFLKSKYDLEKWIDIEAALLDYAIDKTKNGDYVFAKDDKKDYILLCNALKQYLIEQQNNFVPKVNSVGKMVLYYLSRLTKNSCLYTFNYTQLDVLAQKLNSQMGYDAVHIHGSLIDDGNLILGIDTTKPIDENYSFLFKTQNRQYRHTDILKDLQDKDEYIFFGHSLNGMDYSYFNSLFNHLSHNGPSIPRLTIITKNEDDENRFKNFLRKEYVSLQGLYSSSIPTFILTDEVYQENKAEIQKVEDLVNRLNSM